MTTTLTPAQPRTALARLLCTQTVPVGGADPWEGAATPLDGTHCFEQGYTFWRPLPAGGIPVVAHTQLDRSDRPGVNGSLHTEFRDSEGFLILQAWTNGWVGPEIVERLTLVPAEPADAAPTQTRANRDTVSADLMAAHAAELLPGHMLRRFRVRIRRTVPLGAAPTCTTAVQQRYLQDGVPTVDVALTCTLADGTLAAQAWATWACPSAE